MKVLITGDRNWTDREAIRSWLCKLQDWGYTEVIEGGARGADTIAEQEAIKLRMSYQRFPAQCSRYGRAAGVIRNQTMLDVTSPNLVLYFHHDLANSKGTRDMVNRAIKAGVQVINGSEPC